VERLSEREKDEIAAVVGVGMPSRLIGAEIGRHHRTVLGCAVAASAGGGAGAFSVAVVAG
jgi:hypothetical protein